MHLTSVDSKGSILLNCKICPIGVKNCSVLKCRNMLMNQLHEYEDLEDRNRLLKLPVQVGTTVYRIHMNSYIFNGNYVSREVFTADLLPEFGITVFKTEVEAKDALAKILNKEDDNNGRGLQLEMDLR